MITNDPALAERLTRLRNGGQSGRYRHDEAGVNSRLDEMQAAVLRARLAYLPAWTARRRALAARYRAQLGTGAVNAVPECDAGHVYHLFVVRTPARADLQTHLAARGIETLIHYPVPIHRQPAMADADPADCPVASRVCDEILSLPLHPAMADDEVDYVADAVLKGLHECER